MSPMEIAVRAKELSKQYDIYARPADRLIELITRVPRHTVFPALQDVSFDVERGETIGIIGQNGAGKSTLLKLLCNVTRPTSGTLETTGTIASILELGTGFHPEFTGRDNAALNAAILGLTPAEIRKRLPDILEFSELGTFLDRPVKTYSSGMYMRLAFSVAANVEPDILVIDEALAVGDGHFQKKCIDKIRQFQEQRKTILFCSHSLYYVTGICRRTLWLDHGTVMRYGPSVDVVHDYETFLMQRDRSHPAEGHAEPERAPSPVRIRELTISDRAGRRRDRFTPGEEMIVRLKIESDVPSQPIHVLVGVDRSADALQCFAVSTHTDGLPPSSGQREYEVTLQISEMPLLRGEYDVIAYVGDENAMSVFDRRDLRPGFSMTTDRFDVGLIDVKRRWQFGNVAEPVDAAAAPVR
jgi:ABC-type polysaccharide/polyol phosphate transport system ATPase subunit